MEQLHILTHEKTKTRYGIILVPLCGSGFLAVLYTSVYTKLSTWPK